VLVATVHSASHTPPPPKVVFKVPPEQQHPEVAALLHGKKRQMWVMVQVSG
jgi:hypothetical protein